MSDFTKQGHKTQFDPMSSDIIMLSMPTLFHLLILYLISFLVQANDTHERHGNVTN